MAEEAAAGGVLVSSWVQFLAGEGAALAALFLVAGKQQRLAWLLTAGDCGGQL